MEALLPNIHNYCVFSCSHQNMTLIFPSCRALLQCSVLPEILPFYQGTILCMYMALRWKTLLAFLKIAAEDRRSHPWQCAKESNAGAPQGHFSRLFLISCACKGTFEAKHWEDGERNQSSWMRNPGRCKNHAGTATKYMALDLGENAMKINQKGRNSKPLCPFSEMRNPHGSAECSMRTDWVLETLKSFLAGGLCGTPHTFW